MAGLFPEGSAWCNDEEAGNSVAGRTAAKGHALEAVQQLQLRAGHAVDVAGGGHGRAAQVARAALRGWRRPAATPCALHSSLAWGSVEGRVSLKERVEP